MVKSDGLVHGGFAKLLGALTCKSCSVLEVAIRRFYDSCQLVKWLIHREVLRDLLHNLNKCGHLLEQQ